MKEVEITLVVMGDVKNPHTWSGTPYNIYQIGRASCRERV